MESQNKLCRGNMIRACMATSASLTSSTEQKKELMSLTQIFYIYGGPIIWHMLCKIPAIMGRNRVQSQTSAIDNP